jgi:CheY-like chemotaxis protein
MTTIVGMLVSHSAAARKPMAQLLRSHGVQVVEAGSAEEAHGLALFGQLHCVIIDLGDADGLDLCHRFRGTAVTSALPLVLVIQGTDVAVGDVLAAGVSAVLSPRQTVDDLLMAIRRAVAASPATEMARRLA